MFNLQKAGGLAAFFETLAYLIGFGVMATLLDPGNTEGWSSDQKLAFVLERKALFQTWTLFIYVAFGIALVVLTVALHERLIHRAPDLMKIATPFGLIWAGLVIASGMIASVGLEAVAAIHARDVAQATSVWLTIDVVQNGLGGGVEVVGGVWVLLISAAVLRSLTLPRMLGYLGLVVGLSGVLTVVPFLKDLTMVFGISQIFWFTWIGVAMMRGATANHSMQPTALGGG
jgi:hypothetical protein